MRYLRSLVLSFFATVWLTNCAASEEIAKLQESVSKNEMGILLVAKQQDDFKLMMERNMRLIISHLQCKDDEVRKLVEACALGNLQCAPKDIERVLQFMDGYKHTVFYFRPKQSGMQVVPERFALLRSVIQGHRYTINTKLLVLALPNSRLSSDYAEAERVVEEVSTFVKEQVKTLHPQDRVGFMDPRVIGCDRSQDIMRKYERIKDDKPQPGEPTSREARTIVWAFLLDC